jgi:basic amino acid/polyamine antiporter, APA family
VSRALHPLQEVIGRTEPSPGLRRLLGSPALFGIVQGFIAATVYFSLGLVAERALGYTWLVFVAAAVFFVLLVLSYVEGASLHQERGGATVIARYGFNELVSFVAGWAILLDYVLLVALCAFVAGAYAGVLWEPLGDGTGQLVVAFAVVLTAATLNIRGPGPGAFDRAALLVLADLLLQVTVIVLGLALVLEPDVLSAPGAVAGTPAASELAFAFTLVIIAFVGIDASSGLAGQVAIGRTGLRRLISARVVAAVAPLVGLAVLAVSVLPVAALGPDDLQRPVVGVVEGFDQAWLREPLRVLVALSAFAILVGAALTAMLGLSRLGYSLALNRQIPSRLGRLHPRRSTPVVVIAIGTVLALAVVVPGNLGFLAETYAFGAALAFMLVHASVISLRFREAARDRPYRMPLNVGRVPIPAVLGMLASAGALVAVTALGSGARIVGPVWLALGLALYLTYRVTQGKPVLARISVPERSLTRMGEPTAEYGSLLVPLLGSPLDGDIMQTAVRLAAAEETDVDLGEGVVIEAVWVHTIPLSMPLNSPVAEEEIRRAREALDRAKEVGESYGDVRVLPRRVRGRTPGEAIVREARRKGVEAIVLAAEEPTRMRGGLHLGGKPGLHDTYVGATTRYVMQRAPCRIILTAPPADEVPGDGAEGAARPDPGGRGTA